MIQANEKIIMYDSPEAAERVTITGWKSKGDDNSFWGDDEHMARWCGCTHKVCECGNIMSKSYTKCETCIAKIDREVYNKLPFKEWDKKEVVCINDGDKYFFDIDELRDYMHFNNLTEIDLLICDPIHYNELEADDYCQDAHEDWEPEKELEDAVKAFNEVIKTLAPHSWTPGKIRTKYTSK